MRRVVWILTTILAGSPSIGIADEHLVSYLYTPALAEGCLSYAPAEVTLTGTLHSRVFPGPPNYESIRKGDQKETAVILTLVKPACTVGNDGFGGPESDIRDVQLVITKDEHWKIIRTLKRKRVRITGTLFHAHTGHHRTKVLFDVATISRVS